MKHALPVTVTLLLLFIASHLIGLAVINNYVDTEKSAEAHEVIWKELPSIAGVRMERPDLAPTQSVAYIITAIIIGTLLILLIIRLNAVLLWKTWFFLAVTVCLNFALAAFLSPLKSITISVIAAAWKTFKPNIIVQNLTELFLYGGLAAIFVPILSQGPALVSIGSAFALMVILSFYDAYAVWKSKHMITMAKFQTKSGIFAGLLLPSKGLTMPAKKIGKNVKTTMKPVKIAVLGGGDIGFPLLVSGTVLAEFGWAHALLVSSGAAASLLILLLLSQKNKFYPAIPFLTVGCAIGYLLSLLL